MIEKIKKIYLYSAIYGILILFPQLFTETKTGVDFPPPITHPEFYYGFVGLALVFQILFIIISKDPVRYKPVMITGILEKGSFGTAAVILFILGRIPSLVLFFACIDLFIMSLFIYAYQKTPDTSNN